MHRFLIPLCLFLALPQVRAEESAGAAEPSATTWIWKSATPAKGERVFFRREFQLPPDVASAAVTVVCDDSHRVYVNGQDVGTGTGWQNPRTYDVLAKLKPGSRNVIAVEGLNDEGLAGMALRFSAILKSGKKLQVVTDANWLCANEAPDGWQNMDFPSSSWTKAAVIAKMGDSPWGEVMKPEPADPATSVDKASADQPAVGVKKE